MQRPDILDYKDYRQFLKDYYQFKKNLRSGFSFRRFAQMAGIASPNYLQLVMQNKRNFSEPMAQQVAKALGLTGPEKQYFTALVVHENAKTEEERERAQVALLRAVRNLVTREIPKAKIHILTEWYHLVVRELVLLSDFEPSGEWISQRLRHLITPAEADRSFDFLLKTGFLKRENGKYQQSDPVLDTGNAFDETFGLRFHTATLSAWAKMIGQTDRQYREFGVLNIPINSAKIPELQQRMRRFQDELIGWLQDENDPDRIVQLGLYLVPTTTGSKDP